MFGEDVADDNRLGGIINEPDGPPSQCLGCYVTAGVQNSAVQCTEKKGKERKKKGAGTEKRV